MKVWLNVGNYLNLAQGVGPHRAAQGCAGLHTAAQGCARLHRAAQGCRGLHRAAQGYTRLA